MGRRRYDYMVALTAAWLSAVSAWPAVVLGEEAASDEAVATQPAGAIDPLDPPRGVFADEWYAVLLNGKKCGQMRVRMERLAGKDGDLIRTRTKMRVTVKRDTATLSIGVSQASTETIAGEPRSFSRAMYLGSQPVKTEGAIRGGKVHITTEQFGQTSTRTVDLPPGAVMDWGLYRAQLNTDWTPGTQLTVQVYEPTLAPDKTCPTTLKVIGDEQIDLFGRQVQATRIESSMRIPGLLGRSTEQKSTSWITPAGDLLRMTMSVMDIPLEILACTRAVAMSDDDPAELMVDMTVPVGRAIDQYAARTIDYRIRVKSGHEGKFDLDLPETSIQKVTREADGSLKVRVTRLSALPAEAAPPADRDLPDKTTYLAANATLNFRDPAVAELARQAAGDETEPRRVAEALTRFVGQHVTQKTLNVGFATASEVARSQAGDCTEHGVLLAALGRARGIPSRIVTGMVYAPRFGGRSNVLVGHLWTQFWIEGRWVDYDAAFHQVDVDPTHLALSVSPTDDQSIGDLVTSTWLNLPYLQIEILGIDGKD